MPRKIYIADLRQLSSGVDIDHISHVRAGEDDGEFTFNINAFGDLHKISVIVSDLFEYPTAHYYMIFSDDDAPPSVTSIIDKLPSTSRKPICELLEAVSRTVKKSMSGYGGGGVSSDTQMTDIGARDEEEPGSEEDGFDFSDDDFFPEEPGPVTSPAILLTDGGLNDKLSTSSGLAFRRRVRSDWRVVKEAGFKVGVQGRILDQDPCYLSVSCRISKLGISEEAMRAWKIEPSDYLILILHYPQGYKFIDDLRTYDCATAWRNIAFRVGLSNHYKPTLQEAIRAFATLYKGEVDQASQRSPRVGEGFRACFISRPLDELLNNRMILLLRNRFLGMPWGGAEAFYNDNQGREDDHSDMLDDIYLRGEVKTADYPPLVTADHITDSPPGPERSFPLIAMQFLLRHFVRCPEFCLVCHCKLDNDLEAIKPYVCSKGLCLYQYISLGFGPSIEHEIISQPLVVDLLISFCYVSAYSGQLKSFPLGLSLSIPPLSSIKPAQIGTNNSFYPAQPHLGGQGTPPDTLNTASSRGELLIKARVDLAANEMIFDGAKTSPVRPGDWIVVYISKKPEEPLHCRVTETVYFPTIRFSAPITSNASPTGGANTSGNGTEPARDPPAPGWQNATFVIYNQNFDDLCEEEKRQAVYLLLDTLPSVKQMQQYLKHSYTSNLKDWVDRISPAALGILRWIIASNRACIMQVDSESGLETPDEEKLYGMPGWLQFRFAMGAPDKERRFINAVRSAQSRLKLKYPTVFAWHGSPLRNWHSIIREGLHFNDVAHGRAFGNGVYHSLDYHTSHGYCHGFSSVAYGLGGTGAWAQSELKITTAIALNELVNAPQEYVSSKPHLVVSQLDWIQTRYLFVKGVTDADKAYLTDTKPQRIFEQDPAMTPKGVHEKVVIPLAVMPRSRRPSTIAVKTKTRKKLILALGTAKDPISLDDDDDTMSIATDTEDLNILLDEEGDGKSKSKRPSQEASTDFVPGTLDTSKLPMLEEPAYATISASKRLQSDFKQLLTVQAKEPIHELGWYINPDHVTNMYQWVIELHSFEPHLPLAKDMKARGITSVVIELRFGKDYPMSPPFVRIIRPRFLSFMQGGGGHITAGGALCMELLTNNGWSAVSSIESVLLQVRLAMSSTDPKPARLENGSLRDYSVSEAVDAYIRACRTHGWAVPKSFQEIAYGSTDSTRSFF